MVTHFVDDLNGCIFCNRKLGLIACHTFNSFLPYDTFYGMYYLRDFNMHMRYSDLNHIITLTTTIELRECLVRIRDLMLKRHYKLDSALSFEDAFEAARVLASKKSELLDFEIGAFELSLIAKEVQLFKVNDEYFGRDANTPFAKDQVAMHALKNMVLRHFLPRGALVDRSRISQHEGSSERLDRLFCRMYSEDLLTEDMFCHLLSVDSPFHLGIALRGLKEANLLQDSLVSKVVVAFIQSPQFSESLSSGIWEICNNNRGKTVHENDVDFLINHPKHAYNLAWGLKSLVRDGISSLYRNLLLLDLDEPLRMGAAISSLHKINYFTDEILREITDDSQKGMKQIYAADDEQRQVRVSQVSISMFGASAPSSEQSSPVGATRCCAIS